MIISRKLVITLVLLMFALAACSNAATPWLVPQKEKEQPAGSVTMPDGFGIMGDSFYDEYQADNHRGGQYFATTFNLVEILVRARHLNVGPWGTRKEPRRTGYAYNWARSGATSQSLIQQGQHTGLAEQVRQKEVSHVWIGIGANDFSPYFGPTYRDIYEGTMTDEDLQKKIDKAIASVTLAVDTVKNAGPKGIVVTYFTQWELDPLLRKRFPDSTRRLRVANAIDAVNRGIQKMADERQVYALDQNAIGKKLLPGLVDNRYFLFGGHRIDFLECGDSPQFSRLADRSHLGTVMSGITANWYIINTLNEQFGMSIPPLTDVEISQTAGLG